MSDREEDAKQGINVWVDPRRCISNAKCTTAAPGIYVLDEETQVAELVDFDGATLQQLFAGARACPTQAIIIEQYGRRDFPTNLSPMYEAPEADNE